MQNGQTGQSSTVSTPSAFISCGRLPGGPFHLVRRRSAEERIVRLPDGSEFTGLDQFAKAIKWQDQVEILLKAGAVMVAGMVALDEIPIIRSKAAEIPGRQAETLVIPAMNGGRGHQGDAGIGEGSGRRPGLCLVECQGQIDDVIVGPGPRLHAIEVNHLHVSHMPAADADPWHDAYRTVTR